ncbi:MAG: hypothetical protein PHU85_00245 [Phycisphaerae bacterium]|nr:hypothetical protein [Phycisphaerae bacterium]
MRHETTAPVDRRRSGGAELARLLWEAFESWWTAGPDWDHTLIDQLITIGVEGLIWLGR